MSLCLSLLDDRLQKQEIAFRSLMAHLPTPIHPSPPSLPLRALLHDRLQYGPRALPRIRILYHRVSETTEGVVRDHTCAGESE